MTDSPGDGATGRMRAALQHRYGRPADAVTVEDVERPSDPPEGKVVVRVRAASVNRADLDLAAGDKGVVVGGGADVINQYLAAGLVDELELHVEPIVLRGGARLFGSVDTALKLEPVRTIEAPGVGPLNYRVVR